ncbi:MAG: amidohydrolase [Acidobacteria bacterium]|nr:amidohydrolase [Acidobacteriota bacterium]
MRIRIGFLVLGLAAVAGAQAPPLTTVKQAAVEMADGRRGMTQRIVDSLASFSELGYQEFESSAYLCALLEKEGFQVTRGVAGLPTAFVASWGSGKPVIGLMTDIDGLPSTSQKPGVPRQEPLIADGPGHGEGHNTGMGANVVAAIVVKELMKKHGIPGTVRVYPGIAEELIGSRTYMVNAGLFRDLDVMLSSHVSADFGVNYGGPSGTGLISTMYTFHGRSAHAGASPWSGRSALDAVELMNAGWNYRREHINPQHRSHYVIVNGGEQPNVVPPLATVWYYFREWDYDAIKNLHDTGTKIARGAAEMTDTTMTERMLASAWPGHFNKPIAEALYENIKRVGMPAWSEADQKLARAAQREMKAKADGLKTEIGKLTEAKRGDSYGSDDIAEVSWNVPTVVLRYPSNIPGMTGHHWSSGIAVATPIAHKGATAAAKVHAQTVLDLLLKPELLAAAKAYFAEQTKTTQWKSLIPAGAQPPIDLNREKMERVRPQLNKLRYDEAKYPTWLEQLGVKYPPEE